MSLLYRSKIRENEGIEDYLDRIGFHNGFESRRRFFLWLDNEYEDTYGHLGWYSDGDESHYLRKCWYKRIFALEAVLETSIFPALMLANFRFYSSTKKQVCAACWSESDYIRSYWYLVEYRQCHLHNETLMDFDVYGGCWHENVDREPHSHGMICEQVVCKAIKRHSGNNCLEYALVEKYKCLLEVELIKFLAEGFGFVKKSSEIAVLNACKNGVHSNLSLSQRMDWYLRTLGQDNVEAIRILRAVSYTHLTLPTKA